MKSEENDKIKQFTFEDDDQLAAFLSAMTREKVVAKDGEITMTSRAAMTISNVLLNAAWL
jgi:hypothetical protein